MGVSPDGSDFFNRFTDIFSRTFVNSVARVSLFLSSSSLSQSDFFYLFIAGVEGKSWIWPHSTTHTHKHTHTQNLSLCRTPLDEASAPSRDLFLTTHNFSERQTTLTQAELEPTIPTREQPYNYALDNAATGVG